MLWSESSALKLYGEAVAYVSLAGGMVWAGMKMQKTAMFISVITTAVAHFTRRIVPWLSAMTEIRLIIICIKSWISNTQQTRIKKRAGTLLW